MLLPLCLLAACQAVHVDDVARAFDREYHAVRLRFPDKADLSPARADGPRMEQTENLARAYLETADPGSAHGQYVRSLLACALLMRGETRAASQVMAGIVPRDERHIISHRNAVTRAVFRTVAACRSVEARQAIDAMIRRDMEVEEYVQRYGRFVGIYLPSPSTVDFDKILARESRVIRQMCFAKVSGDPRAMERISEGRTEVHRLLAEQIYNDAAALLVQLPSDDSPESEWVNFVAASLILVYGEIFGELVPMDLRRDQKEWQLEQMVPVFDRAEKVVARLGASERHEIYARLPRRMQRARIGVRGWIETR